MIEKPSNKKKWITCAVILVILICISIVMFLGWNLTSNLFVNNGPTELISVEVESDIHLDENLSPPLSSKVPFQAVVQILALYEEDGEYFIGWTGSGSIISPNGLILTNAHVVLPDRYFNVDVLAVALTIDDDLPPEITYIAEVVQANEALDIAVIQIIQDIDENPIDPANLNLPYVALGDSDTLNLGDDISILGYPSIGGETITYTTGEVSGFTAETDYGNRAFIKTSATIAGGNSGGLATDSDGKLIGIPTQLGYGGDGQFVDCRVLEDTNRDGYVDENDSCIPTGGFINALRPLRLALPLIEAAKNGEVSIKYIEIPTEDYEAPVSGSVLYQDDFSNPNSGWGTLESPDGNVGYVDGQLHVEVLVENYIVWSNPEKSFNDIIVSVEVNLVRPVGDGEFGILCGYKDMDNFYGLEISEDGYYTIWKYTDGEYVSIVDWQSSSLIPLNSDQYIVTVSCTKRSLALAVDGTILVETSDPEFSNGDVGLIVGTLDQPGIIVGFDNFLVTDWVP